MFAGSLFKPSGASSLHPPQTLPSRLARVVVALDGARSPKELVQHELVLFALSVRMTKKMEVPSNLLKNF
jgi:hypothetical protein